MCTVPTLPRLNSVLEEGRSKHTLVHTHSQPPQTQKQISTSYTIAVYYLLACFHNYSSVNVLSVGILSFPEFSVTHTWKELTKYFLNKWVNVHYGLICGIYLHFCMKMYSQCILKVKIQNTVISPKIGNLQPGGPSTLSIFPPGEGVFRGWLGDWVMQYRSYSTQVPEK